VDDNHVIHKLHLIKFDYRLVVEYIPAKPHSKEFTGIVW